MTSKRSEVKCKWWYRSLHCFSIWLFTISSSL